MKMILSTIAIVVLVTSLGATLLIGAQAVYATPTPRQQLKMVYETGLSVGKSDARQQDTTKWQILQYEMGFQFMPKEFIKGYVIGFCSVAPHTSSDDYRASWDCDKGPDSASWVEDPAAD
jgi:hypothetical protein